MDWIKAGAHNAGSLIQSITLQAAEPGQSQSVPFRIEVTLSGPLATRRVGLCNWLV